MTVTSTVTVPTSVSWPRRATATTPVPPEKETGLVGSFVVFSSKIVFFYGPNGALNQSVVNTIGRIRRREKFSTDGGELGGSCRT